MPPATGRPPDPVLVVRARDGDTAAWDALVEARLDGSWRLARAILDDDASAAEAVSNAFAAGWRELPRLEDASRFDDWLDRILLGECRMRLRSAGGPGGAIPPVPEGLLAAVRATVALAPRPPRPPAASRRGSNRRSPWRTVAVLVAVVAILAVGVGVAANRGWIPGLTSTSSSPAPSSAGQPPASADPGGSTEPGATPAPSPLEPLAHGTLAIVTLDGNDLRVRSRPGTGDDSKMLKPRLPPNTRLLIVDGPVAADGYDWYEVQTDAELIDRFGWVAAGEDGVAWIAPTPARCFGEPDVDDVALLARIDYLTCHGDATVKVEARTGALWDGRSRGDDCGWIRRRDGCDLDAGWLLTPTATVGVTLEDGTTDEIVVAVPPDLADKLARVPRQGTGVLTLSMDSPEAAQCKARDAATGELLISSAHALTACRLQFVVQEVEVRMSGESSS
jgi:hypothetical protein